MIKTRVVLRNLFIAAALVAAPTLAQAQQAIKLTIIDGYPPKALWVKVLIDYFMPEVNKRLAADGNKYKIDWQQAFSGQIAKPRGVMDALKNKLGDIGVVATVFHSSKLPLNNLPYYTPFVSRDPILVGKVMDDPSRSNSTTRTRSCSPIIRRSTTTASSPRRRSRRWTRSTA
jgi:C4-dicarboxylate-binding protein DctP